MALNKINKTMLDFNAATIEELQLQNDQIGLLSELNVRLPPFNIKNDGSDTSGTTMNLQAALNAGVGKTVIIPDGIYTINATLDVPKNVNIRFGQNAILKVVSVISSVLRYPLSQQCRNNFIEGGVINCNGKADIGIELRNFAYFGVLNTKVMNFQQAGIKLGDTSAPSTSYEGMLTGILTERTNDVGIVPVGSKALWIAYGGDHKFLQSIIKGAEIGVRNDGAACHFTQVHCWNYVADTGWMLTGFDDNGSNSIYVSCYADTVKNYGFRYRGNQPVSFVSCRVFNNNVDGLDNDGTVGKTYTGIYFDHVAPTATILDLKVIGNDSTHRMFKNIDVVSGGDLGGVTILGVKDTNVVNTSNGGTRIGTVSSIRSSGYVFSDGFAGNDFRGFFVGTNGKYRWKAGSDNSTEDGAGAGTNYEIVAYDDNGSTKTQVFKFDRKSKTPVFPALITAANDSAAAIAGVPINGIYKDSTGVVRIRVV